MRILHLGGSYFAEALRQAGHTVYTAGLGSNADRVLTHPITIHSLLAELSEKGFVPDLSILCDDGNLPIFLGIEKMPCLSFFFSIDTYCNHWHLPYMHLFDHSFIAQRNFVEIAEKELNEHAEWMPLFARASILCEAEDEKNWLNNRTKPVSFVGTLHPVNNPKRFNFLQQFALKQEISMMQGNFVPVFTSSRIVLNQSADAEINFRCFEAMACGAALLTDFSPQGMDLLFTEGENILPAYPQNDAVRAAATARAALRASADLAKIAHNGRELVRTRHLDTHRAQRILAAAQQYGASGITAGRIQNSTRTSAYARAAYGMVCLDMKNPEMWVHKKFYAKLANGQ